MILKNFFLVLIGLIFSMSVTIGQSDGAFSGNHSFNVRVVLDHIFISRVGDSIGISEIAVFRNEGQEIYYTGDNHTYFAISTPPGLKNLKTDVMECCLLQEERTVYFDPMLSLKPGEKFEMKISYELENDKKKYVLNKSAVYNTTSLSIFIDRRSGVDIDGVRETITLSGKEYYAIVFEDLKPGDTVEIPFMIAAQTGYLNYFYAASGLFILLLSGSVYHFRERLFRRKIKYTFEELELKKRKIFQAIQGFEKHEAEESSEEYMRLIEEYKQKGIDIKSSRQE